MTECLLCGGPHHFTECPLFGATKTYLETVAPKAPTTTPQPGDAPASPLAPPPPVFTQLFGEGAEGLLQDVVEDPERWTPEQQMMALKVLSGELDLGRARGFERELLDEMAIQLALITPGPRVQQQQQLTQRPTYMSTQAEMENFDQEYQPPPDRQDWPGGDFPEGYQG